MKLMERAIQRRPLIITVVFLLSLLGIASWFGMDRQEDPFFPYRYAQVLVPWPGAQPERVQRLVVEIIEDELAGVEEVREIRSTARLGFANLIIGLESNVYDTDNVWDRVRVALETAERRIPDRAGPIELRDRSMDTHGIVLALTGDDDLLVLLEAARTLRRDLFTVPGIGRIDILGDPGEQLRIRVDPARLMAAGLTMDQLAQTIAGSNEVVPGGALRVDERNLIIQPLSDLGALDELRALSIATASGALIRLGDIADIMLQPAEPVGERIHFRGQPAVTLGIIVPREGINAVTFGESVRARVAELQGAYAPI